MPDLLNADGEGCGIGTTEERLVARAISESSEVPCCTARPYATCKSPRVGSGNVTLAASSKSSA
jgi:hypothetical protein